MTRYMVEIQNRFAALPEEETVLIANVLIIWYPVKSPHGQKFTFLYYKRVDKQLRPDSFLIGITEHEI